MVDQERQFTLLLVDDNPTNVLLLVKIIELDLPEVRVVTASSAIEGLKLADEEQIDGAFIDVQMPQVGGLEMCRQLRANPHTSTIPLVLMTAHVASPEMRAEGLEVGAYDFISQPISNVEMLARIKVMLRLCEGERRFVENNQHLQEQVLEHTSRLRWISGLLMSGDGSLTELDQQLLHHLANELPDPVDINVKLFFETLVTEFPLPWRRTLLKLALLGKAPVSLAQKLSEISDVEAVFDYLSQNQLALLQPLDGENYLFLKPEARDLLCERAKHNLTEEERQQVYLVAADWYRQREDFPTALELLISTEQYTAVSHFLSRVGLTLLNRNYSSQIAPLINQIPETFVKTCGWLSLFRGINYLQQPAIDPDGWLELAYQHFQEVGPERGELLSLAQQMYQTVIFGGSFDFKLKRLERFKRLTSEQLTLMAPIERLKVSYLLGLTELLFTGDLSSVEKILTVSLAEAQQSQFLEEQVDLNLLRALCALQQGRYLVARTALEQGLNLSIESAQLVSIGFLQVVACSLLHASGELDGLQQQRKMLTDNSGYSIQKDMGISALFDHFTASLLLARGEQQRALETIEIALIDAQAAKNLQVQNRLLQSRGWIRALSGQESGSLFDLERSLHLRGEIGGTLYQIETLLIAGATCFALQRFDQAAQYLYEGLAQSHEYKEERYRTGLHAWLAVVQNKRGDSIGANEQVRSFFDLLKRHRTAFFWGMNPGLIDELLPLIKENHDRILLQPFLREHLFSALNENNRRVPLLKVSCLGKFQLEIERQTFDLNQVGQASRQIFSLLVVAQDSSLSIELIMGILWPESPPRKARNSFDTAHSRLRKALEGCFGKRIRQDYLILEKGMLSLRYAQVDSVRFAEIMGTVRYHMQREHFWQAEQALWKMDRLWSGEFLSGYDLDGELPLQREQLTQLRLEQLSLLARLLQRQHQQKGAIELLKKGLLIDPTYDPIIRQLLALYRQQQDSFAVGLLLGNYRIALQNEEYEPEEIDELIEALGV